MVRKTYRKKRVVRKLKKRTYKKRGPSKYIPKADTRAERKWVDIAFSGNSATSTPYRSLINGVVVGSNVNSRIGNKITMVNIEIQGRFYSNAAGAVKALIVYDKQTNGSNYLQTDLFNSIAGNFYPWVTRNTDFSQRFVVLKNWNFTLIPAITSTYAIKPVKWFLKCRAPVEFNSTSGAIADINKGSLFFQFQTDGTSVLFDGTVRVRYVDT